MSCHSTKVHWADAEFHTRTKLWQLSSPADDLSTK